MNRQAPPSLDDRILIVDDDANDRELLAAGLRAHGFPCEVAGDGVAALDRLNTKAFTLLLADVRMPRMDGIQLLQIVHASHSDMVTIITTAADDRTTAVTAMRHGAYDFITKPFSLEEVVFSVRRALEQRRLSVELRVYRQALERKVADRTRELQDLHEELKGLVGSTIAAFGLALEARDAHAAQHARRVAALVERLAGPLDLSARRAEVVRQAALLHEVGKLGASEALLQQDEGPTETERDTLRAMAEQVLRPIRQLESVIVPIRHLHEAWDGSGRPDGLVGEAIPLESRILAIADGYDSLASARPHRRALSHAKAMQVLRNGAGHQWDPHLVALFEEVVTNHSAGLVV